MEQTTNNQTPTSPSAPTSFTVNRVPPVGTPTTIPPVVPPTPPAMPPSSHSERRLVLPALLLVLILAGAYYWYVSHDTDTTAPVAPAGATSTTTNEVVASEPSTPHTLPAGFPSGVPIDTNTLTEAYTLSYPSHGVTQFTASYTTALSKDALWKQYTDYLTSAGYALDTTTTNKSQGVLRATKAKNEYDITITSQSGKTLVQITYLERA